MNLQDRAFAVGVFVILGICCIGAYVAVSGFFNANPGGLSLGLGGGTPSVIALPSVAVAVGTIDVASPTPFPTVAVALPTNTPKGFKPSPTPISRGTPSPVFLSDIPTAVPATPGTSATQPVAPTEPAASGCGAKYCPRIGKADSTYGPQAKPCPIEYLWGVVYDKTGKPLANKVVRYQLLGDNSENVTTKGPPDTRIGVYEIIAGGGTWNLQLFGDGVPLSPIFKIQAHQTYNGGATCPNRVDFVEQ